MIAERQGPSAGEPGDEPVRYRVLSVRVIAAWAVLIVLVGVGMAAWLLLAYTGGVPRRSHGS